MTFGSHRIHAAKLKKEYVMVANATHLNLVALKTSPNILILSLVLYLMK